MLTNEIEVNYLGPALFTELLEEPLSDGKPGKVIFTASEAHRFYKNGILQIDELPQKQADFSAFNTYGLSKLCQILYTKQYQILKEKKGIQAFSFHPGFVSTNIGSDGIIRNILFFITYPM